MNYTEEKRSTEEAYACAITASSLRVEADKTQQIDLLIAMGWNKSRTGAALLRLRTEYDAHARAPGEDNATAMRLLCGNLRSLADVLREVEGWATRARMDRPRALTLAVVAWWLSKNCKKCTGRKFELVLGSPSLSARLCTHCHGGGEAPIPHGGDGKNMVGMLESCTQNAAQSIKNRVRRR